MNMVPLVDLRAQYHSIKSEIDAAIARVLESCEFVLGQEVEGFEKEFATYCGAQHAIGVNSGTSALHLALLACRNWPGGRGDNCAFYLRSDGCSDPLRRRAACFCRYRPAVLIRWT
jgi:dTDP-4-amino-4,6-dideoxygalactose transaminase